MNGHGDVTGKHPVCHERDEKMQPRELPSYLRGKGKKTTTNAERGSWGFMGSQCGLPFWYAELRFWNHRLWEYFCPTHDLSSLSCVTLREAQGGWAQGREWCLEQRGELWASVPSLPLTSLTLGGHHQHQMWGEPLQNSTAAASKVPPDGASDPDTGPLPRCTLVWAF